MVYSKKQWAQIQHYMTIRDLYISNGLDVTNINKIIAKLRGQ